MIKLNKIYNEDCLEGMKHIHDGSVDMILCDLPYGTTKNSWDSIIPLEKLWNHYKRVIKENGAIVLTAQTPFDKILGCSNLDMLRYEWIWKKNKATGHLNANKAPMKLTENILVFYKKSPIYNPQGVFKKHTPTIRKAQSNGPNYGKSDIAAIQEFENYPKNLLRFKLDINAFHPTQKPLSLFEYLIKTYTNKGDLVLDNCMGSGTTAVACLNTERNFIGFEKNIDYYEKSLKRIENNETQLELF